jgi:hypothetical protein
MRTCSTRQVLATLSLILLILGGVRQYAPHPM